MRRTSRGVGSFGDGLGDVKIDAVQHDCGESERQDAGGRIDNGSVLELRGPGSTLEDPISGSRARNKAKSCRNADDETSSAAWLEPHDVSSSRSWQ